MNGILLLCREWKVEAGVVVAVAVVVAKDDCTPNIREDEASIDSFVSEDKREE